MNRLALFLCFIAFTLAAGSEPLVLLQNGTFTLPVRGRTELRQSGAPARLWHPSAKNSLFFDCAQTPIDPGEYYTFSLLARTEGDDPVKLRIQFSADDGTQGRKYLTILPDTGWRRYRIRTDELRKILHGKSICSIRFSVNQSGRALFLDDIRFSPRELSARIPDLPPVTASTSFPAHTDDAIIRACLNAPEYRKKMAAIEKLRQRYAAQWNHPRNRTADAQAEYDAIRPDGSIPSLSPEKVRQRERAGKSNRGDHEGVMRQILPEVSRIARHWKYGRVDRTLENSQKLLRMFNYYLSMEANRLGEHERWVTTSFYAPALAANAYFTFFREMEAVEKGTEQNPELVLLNQLCREIVAYAFVYPDYNRPGPLLTTRCFRFHDAWTGGNFGYRNLYEAALICRNPRMMDLIAEISRDALSITSFQTRDSSFWREGLTADGGGWGHGEIHYLFRYPADGVRGIVRNLLRLKGTLWDNEISTAQYRLLVEYLKTCLWFCLEPAKYGPTLTVPDRECMRWTPDGGFLSIDVLLSIAQPLAELLPAKETELRHELDTILRISKGEEPEYTGVRFWWNNDDLVIRRKNWFAGVNMVSKRTIGVETAALASIKTDYFADGATWLMKHGATYTIAKGFFQTWAVPGTTVRAREIEHTDTAWRAYRGTSGFAGGVADGAYGCAAFLYGKQPIRTAPDPALYGVTARKSYFAFDDQLLCLGADIRNEKPELPEPIVTTIDQTEWITSAEIEIDGVIARKQPGETFHLTGKSGAVWQNGIGYLVMQGGPMTVSGETRPERWLEFNRSRNSRQKNRPKQASIFQITIDHGRAPAGGSYAYLVDFEVKNLAELQKKYENSPIRILANNAEVQAVYHPELKLLYAIFYRAGASFRNGDDLWRANTPAIMMWKEDGDGTWRLLAADPEQDVKKQEAVFTVERGGKRSTYTVALPSVPYCGRAGELSFKSE